MKSIYVGIILLLACAHLGSTSQLKESSRLKTGQIELFSSFTGQGMQKKTFSVTEDYQQGDRFAINLQDFKVDSTLYQNYISKIAWVVKVLEEFRIVTLEVTHHQSSKNTQSNWAIVVNYIIIGSKFSQDVFFLQNIKIGQLNKINSLNNQMLLTVSSDAQALDQKDVNYEIIILYRGFEAKGKDYQSSLQTKMGLKGYFVTQTQIHIEKTSSHIKNYYITLLIINKPKLLAYSIKIIYPQLSTTKTQRLFTIIKEFSIHNCSLGLKMNNFQNCWQMTSLKKTLQFDMITNVEQTKVQQYISNQYSKPQYQKTFSLYGRLLSGSGGSGCQQGSCSCDSSISHAVSCYEDNRCNCKIQRCSNGYYTTTPLANSCTRCPTSLTNCLDCSLYVGSPEVACTSCASGYLPINGICTSCPKGCSSCSPVLVDNVVKVTCTACSNNLVIQTSGSVKVCGCLSSQFLDLVANPIVCINCPATCSSCISPTICTSCISGYYSSNSSCLVCMPVCKTCLSGSTCSSCLSTTFLNIAGVCTCPSTLFFDSVTRSCLPCSSLKNNCASCSYSSTFNSSNPPSVVCTTPNTGYFISSGSTTACVSYCSSCNSTLSCSISNTNFTFDAVNLISICSTGLYFSKASNTCLSCQQAVPGCLSANCQTTPIPDFTLCTLCNSGFFNSSTLPTTSCSPCPSLCLTCTASNACISCINNLTVLVDGTCGCNSTSSLFLNPTTLDCLSCSTVIFNCQNCATNGSSVTCATCITGNYPSTTGMNCFPCPSTCSACLNSSYCSACEAGYDLVLNACVCGTNCSDCMSNSTGGTCSSCTLPTFSCLSCITGFVYNSGNCLACNATWTSCIQCTASTCLACQSPFILSTSGCVCNNTAGLYLTNSNLTCLACSSIISQCTTCSWSNLTSCLSCNIGYFVSSLQVCSPCTGFCLTCSNTSSHCDTCLLTYSMVSANTCDCNITGGYFYDSSTSGCSSCSILISNCLTCILNGTNKTQCTYCDNNYYWNTTTFLCESCSSSCNNCSSYSVCTSCSFGLILVSGACLCDNATSTALYLDPLSGQCLQCSSIITGCSSCSQNNSVIICANCIDSTYLINNTCANCPATCATCNSTGCLSCPGTLTLSSGQCICNTLCQQCNILSVGCLSCLIVSNVISTCYNCIPGTYLATPNCISCPSTCATCTSSYNCTTCQTSYVLINGVCSCATSIGMFPNSSGVCSSCSTIYYACAQCDISGGATVCITCSDGYYLSGASCLPCERSCPTCSGSSTTCTSCPQGQTLLSGGICACTSDSCLACSAVSSHCSQCIYTIYGNFSKCDTCSAGYYVDGANCSPCPSICKSCGANGACLSCPVTFEIINQTCLCNSAKGMWNSGGTCVSCSSIYSNCQTCTQNSSVGSNLSCIQCTYGSYQNNSACIKSDCGDGNITSGEACDDKNKLDGDGCSSFCQIETDFTCTGSPSICQVHVNFNITPTDIEVSKQICNHVSISFSISPVYDSYDSADFKNMLGFVSQSRLVYKSWSYKKGKITYQFDYLETLSDAITTFYFTPSNLVSETSTLPIIAIKFALTPTNNVLIVYYDQQICQSKELVQALTAAIEYTSYGVLIASALPCKIVGLQLFGVLQQTHINVGNMDNVNTMMTPLMGMKGVHGFSFNLGQQSNSSNTRLLQGGNTPARVQSIGYQSNFLRNSNLMLFIVVLIIIISTILYTLTYCCKGCAPSLHSISKRIIKQVLLTLILFNCYNFAYSAGIHFNYASTSDHLYTAGTIAAVLSIVLPVLMALGLMCAEDQGFGEYKQKFKPGIVDRLYFVVTILYRTGIGLYTSTMNQDQMSTLIVIALSIAFLLYNLVNLPYSKAYHNYRANICHFTQFVSLFVAMYYRSMKSTTSRTSVSKVFAPAYIQYACICLSLLVSMIVLVYQIYIFIKDCLTKKQNQNRVSQVSINNQKNASKIHDSQGNIEFEENKFYTDQK